MFVGYDSEKKGWRCYDPSTRKCSMSRNVVFDETSSWWLEHSEYLSYIIKDNESVNSHQVYLPFFGIVDTEHDMSSTGDEQPSLDQPLNVSSSQNPWNTGVFSQGSAYVNSSRRSTRIRTPNPRYTHVATIAKEVKEP